MFAGIFTSLFDFIWTIIQILCLISFIVYITKKKIPAEQVARWGFILLAFTVFSNIIRQDILAGKIAEFVWILFSISFVMHFKRILQTKVESQTE